MSDTEHDLGQYVDASAIAGALGIARSGVFNLVRRGMFPAGVKIGNSRRWNLAEIKAWLDTKKEESR